MKMHLNNLVFLQTAQGGQVTVCALSFDQGFYKSTPLAAIKKKKKTNLGQQRFTNETLQSNRAVSMSQILPKYVFILFFFFVTE